MYNSTWKSTVKTTVLLAFLVGLFVLIGRLLGGPTGMILGLGFGLVMNFGAYWFSDKIVLKMARAHEVSAAEAPDLYNLVSALARNAHLPMPRVYIVNDPSPNAFATGRNPKHAAVAVNTGLLNLLSRDELAAVLAHELAHVKHRDTLIQAVVATVAGTITFVAHMAQWAMIFGGFGGNNDDEGAGSLLGGLVLIIVAPIAALLIQLAISRSREYAADAGGAEICGQPMALASALHKLESGTRMFPQRNVNPSTAHLYIVNPFAGKSVNFSSLFSTHPPIEERIDRLEHMALGTREIRPA